MTDSFHFISEPALTFGEGQEAEDPRDGLALFGPFEKRDSLSDHIVIGTKSGIELWQGWCNALNAPAACVDINRQRPWPPYPGFEVAFGAPWPNPARSYTIDNQELDNSARKSNRFERAYSVANLYMGHIRKIQKLDSRPTLAILVVPDSIYDYCRPKSSVSDRSDSPRTAEEKKFLTGVLKDHEAGQSRFDIFDEDGIFDSPENLEQYGLSPDFRRQIKARVMKYEIPVQIVRESTLTITEQIRNGEKGVNPLSDRLWNLGTGLFYKSGQKPWKTPWARDGVCYVGIAYKKVEHEKVTACCAAQLFLDSGDGIVFVGDFGPWYSKETEEFHLTSPAAEKMLRGTISAYKEQDGRPLKEVFLHSRSGINRDEYDAFQRALPAGVKLTAIRVRKDKLGPRLMRWDSHPKGSRRGMHPVLRGTFWQQSQRHGYLFTSGFKPRIGAYDGWEIPVPLSITVQYGDTDLLQVAKDILGLTKLNYNACQLGESEPITVKYSSAIGEILLANSEVSAETWRHNFKYYM
jgi:hypothetical protein